MQAILGMRTIPVRIVPYGKGMHPELFTYNLKDLKNQHIDARQGGTPGAAGSSRLRKPRPSRRR